LVKLWLPRIAAVLLAAFLAAYGGDWILFKLRGLPSSTVTVNRYQNVPLKDNKIEYDYLGSSDVPCSESLFPQAGLSPCWQLRRHANQTTNL
jgi:hypothetical protein